MNKATEPEFRKARPLTVPMQQPNNRPVSSPSSTPVQKSAETPPKPQK
jgi:hypothetical protein